MRRAGLEVRKRWGRVRREEKESSMEARRVERLEAFSMMALGGKVSRSMYGGGCKQPVSLVCEGLSLPVNYGNKRCYGTGGTGSCSDIGSDPPW